MPRKARKLDVVCQNKFCREFGKRGLRNIILFGWQANKTRRYCCTSCRKTFSRTRGTPFFRKHLKKKEVVQICKMFAEKTPFRGVARQTEHHLDTVRSLAAAIGDHCKRFNDYFIKELKLDPVEVDEMWSFIKKRRKTA